MPKKAEVVRSLHYNITDGGDGSVSLHLHKTEEKARKADHGDDGCNGFGESTYGAIQLKAEGCEIFYRSSSFERWSKLPSTEVGPEEAE